MGIFLIIVCILYACFVVGDADRLTLEEKVNNLQDMLLKKPMITLNNERWHSYVQSAPRNYSVVVMFTVLSQRMNCPICKYFLNLRYIHIFRRCKI